MRTLLVRVAAAPIALLIAVSLVIHLGAAWLRDVQRTAFASDRSETRHG